jgi:hypothetical protein
MPACRLLGQHGLRQQCCPLLCWRQCRKRRCRHAPTHLENGAVLSQSWCHCCQSRILGASLVGCERPYTAMRKRTQGHKDCHNTSLLLATIYVCDTSARAWMACVQMLRTMLMCLHGTVPLSLLEVTVKVTYHRSPQQGPSNLAPCLSASECTPLFAEN